MKLSNQAMGAIMMALQKALMEQTDIIVKNPPSFKVDNDTLTDDPSLDGED
mgnify:CR=1 FL=1